MIGKGNQPQMADFRYLPDVIDIIYFIFPDFAFEKIG
jgi:hypothetical protein